MLPVAWADSDGDGVSRPCSKLNVCGRWTSTIWDEGVASAAGSRLRTGFCVPDSERSDPDLVWTRHDPGVWSRDRCLTLTVLRHSTSASNPADGGAFWTLGYPTGATGFVETATNTSCVRDASGRISINLGTAPHRHPTLAAIGGRRWGPGEKGGKKRSIFHTVSFTSWTARHRAWTVQSTRCSKTWLKRQEEVFHFVDSLTKLWYCGEGQYGCHSSSRAAAAFLPPPLGCCAFSSSLGVGVLLPLSLVGGAAFLLPIIATKSWSMFGEQSCELTLHVKSMFKRLFEW